MWKVRVRQLYDGRKVGNLVSGFSTMNRAVAHCRDMSKAGAIATLEKRKEQEDQYAESPVYHRNPPL